MTIIDHHLPPVTFILTTDDYHYDRPQCTMDNKSSPTTTSVSEHYCHVKGWVSDVPSAWLWTHAWSCEMARHCMSHRRRTTIAKTLIPGSN